MKTTYHLCNHERVAKEPDPSCFHSWDLWQKIWSAPIQVRVKHFLWRLARNILPTKTNLKSKGVDVDDTCELCHYANESTNHLFTNCDFFRRSFFVSIIGGHVQDNTDINCWLSQILINKSVIFVQAACYLLHHVWKARNHLVFKMKA